MLQNERRPYIIYRVPPGYGFWSNFSVVLQGLKEADQRNLVPVVDMERYATRYSENELVNGTLNAWEYYFEQPTELTLADALAQDHLDNGGIVRQDPFTSCFALIVPPPETLAMGRELIRKFIRVKPEIQQQVDALLTPGDGMRWVGVHVRGTDQRYGRVAEHPAPAIPAAYLEQVALLDDEHSFTKVFLATDEHDTVEMFAERFGSRLFTISAHRTTSDHEVSDFVRNYDWLFDASERHLHRYQLGLEVLVDALLLSRCGHLVCGASNVSHAAMYFASESQIVHTVPPLWIYAASGQHSSGLAYVAALPASSYKHSAAILEQNMQELREIIHHTENTRALAYDRSQELVDLESELKDSNTRLLANIEHLQKNMRDLQASAVAAELQSRSTVADLQTRLIRAYSSAADSAEQANSVAFSLKTRVQELDADNADLYARFQILVQTHKQLENSHMELGGEFDRMRTANGCLNVSVIAAEVELAAFRNRLVIRLLDAFVHLRRRLF